MILKPSQIRDMSYEERGQKIENLKKELYELRNQAKSSRIEKPHRFRQARKELARLLTIQKEHKKT